MEKRRAGFNGIRLAAKIFRVSNGGCKAGKNYFLADAAALKLNLPMRLHILSDLHLEFERVINYDTF